MKSSTVAFEELAAPAGGRPALAPMLNRIVSSRYGTDDPVRVLRALVTCGLAVGYHSGAVRHWVLGSPRALHLVPLVQTSSWQPLVRSVRSFARTSAAAGPRGGRLVWARRGVARAVSPLPRGVVLSPTMEARARTAMLVITSRALDEGFSNLMVTRSWLGLQLNLRPGAAGVVLTVLEKKLNWIRRVRGSGSAIRWRLNDLDTQELRDAAWLRSETIAALADNEPEQDYLATLISQIRNPAWAYSPSLGHRAWLRAALPYMEADGNLGLGPVAYRKLGRALKAELPGVLEGSVDLAAVLEEYAEASFATFIYEDRKIDLAAEAFTNIARLNAVRLASDNAWTSVKAARVILRDAWDACGRVPDGVPAEDQSAAAALRRDAIRLWVDAAALHLVANPIDPEMLPSVRAQLSGILIKRGHDDALTKRIVDHVLPDLSA